MFFHSQGLRLAYDDQGSGLPLVFLHAFPLNRTMWAPQIAALSHHFRTIAMDFRGHGESDAPLWNFTLEQYADDVAALLDHLALAQAVLVGLSMGGYVSLAFARKYADRLKGLVLADTRAQADTQEARAGRFHLAQTAWKDGSPAVANTMLPKLLGATSRQANQELMAYVRKMILTTPVSGVITDLMAMADRPDSVRHLSVLSCPTLIVVGQEDNTTPLSDAQLMAERISGARLAIIPSAGHLSNLEQPKVFCDLLQDFASVEGGGRKLS
jgi:3-oxoadipate enol-lactonase